MMLYFFHDFLDRFLFSLDTESRRLQPTIVDNSKDYEKAKEALAKQLHKKVEDLTEDEEDKALAKIGLCPLDFMD